MDCGRPSGEIIIKVGFLLNCMIQPLLEIDEYNQILKSIKDYSVPLNINGPSDSQKVHLAYAICSHLDIRGLFVTYNEMQARKLYDDFSYFLGDRAVLFTAKEIMLHDIAAKSNDAVHQRIKTLSRIAAGEYSVIVASAEAMMQKLVPLELFRQNMVAVKTGMRLWPGDLAAKLMQMGYERVAAVEGKGQFAVRGGIFDIFPVISDLPSRVEFFDDEVDSIRTFSILNQRSVDKLKALDIPPARDVIYSVGDREGIVKAIREDLAGYLKKLGRKEADLARHVRDKIEADLERFGSEYYFPGIDRYIPYIIDKPAVLLDYTGSLPVFFDEPPRFRQRIENMQLEHDESCKALLEKGRLLPGSFGMYFDSSCLEERFAHERLVVLQSMMVDNSRFYRNYSIPAKQISSYQGQNELLAEDLKLWKEKGYRTIILSGTKGRGERIAEALELDGIFTAYTENNSEELLPGQIIISKGALSKGFEYPSIGLAVISDSEAFGQQRKARKNRSKKQGDRIRIFTDLNIGDYVVHQSHGIGQYTGIEKLVVDNTKRDYLKIRYQEGDLLYIPTSQLDLIQKYIGPEGKTPRVNKLGGSEWAKTRSRVKESLKELAAELVRLYALRQSTKGYAFSRDTIWQKQFEELFPYEETEDQLKCIEEIKQDMQSERLMDRLLCGDVGYGKTEVAIRAVFKAVMDGKQVAFLVPTTVLAQQHYVNFKERMKDFPVAVDVISRFRSASEQKKILKELKSGMIDVLVGTHRLIQKDIQFKDLGLLVVDEEQRFGVTHKEKLKNIKPTVDVLTLTATPIPRTLHMSLTGIRDISVIEDPPEERYPVQTYVMEYSEDVIRDGIYRELGRKGQVFYLYNRVRSIQIKAMQLRQMVPEARIAVAHGQMDEKELENIMYDFIKGEYDVLVCTTIIESGLDMPNVNTIVVEDADKMGLAQLYQLRGRVGRSNRLAYAYITYKKDKVLQEIAEKRLQAIKEFTEFGSGFKIAMRDLEIRGAGNLLGPEQHGHMESVGYDMYCRLLDEAVRELKGEPPGGIDTETVIDININAYIDDEYIAVEEQKIEMYKKIAAIQDENDVMDIEDEFLDRYGEIPQPVRNLISIALIKSMLSECGFSSLIEKNDALIFQCRDDKSISIGVISALGEKYRRQLLFNAGTAPYLMYKPSDMNRASIPDTVKVFLKDILAFRKDVSGSLTN